MRRTLHKILLLIIPSSPLGGIRGGLLLLLLLLFPTSCKEDKRVAEVTDAAEGLLETRADSALTLLDGIAGEMPSFSKKQRMRYRLIYAEAQNKAFVPVTHDSTLLEVAAYYRKYGTDNDLMRAYYMVGCAYRDKGDAPTALKYFRMAAEAADMTDADCDLNTLLRIHSQMGSLFNNVCAFKDERHEYDVAESLAWATRDTVSALRIMWMKATSLHVQERYDASVALIDSMRALEKRFGLPECVECNYPMRIDACLLAGDTAGAATLLREYEGRLHIGPLSPDADIANPSYHYHKGRYYLLAARSDSAIVQFKRLLSRSAQYEFRELAYKGLQEAYSQTHQADSAVKYAALYAEANDSTTRHRSSEVLLRMQSLYNYTQAQEQAAQAEQKTFRLKVLFCAMLVVLLCAAAGSWRIYRRHMRKIHQKQTATSAAYLSLIQRLKDNVSQLQQLKTDTDGFLKTKQEEVASLRKALLMYQTDALDVEQWSTEREILDSQIAGHLHALAARGRRATADETDRLCVFAQTAFPAFHKFITDEAKHLSPREITVCTLIRFQFISSEIGVLSGLTPQQVTNIKAAVNRKLFNAAGAKTLMSRLSRLK